MVVLGLTFKYLDCKSHSLHYSTFLEAQMIGMTHLESHSISLAKTENTLYLKISNLSLFSVSP